MEDGIAGEDGVDGLVAETNDASSILRAPCWARPSMVIADLFPLVLLVLSLVSFL